MDIKFNEWSLLSKYFYFSIISYQRLLASFARSPHQDILSKAFLLVYVMLLFIYSWHTHCREMNQSWCPKCACCWRNAIWACTYCFLPLNPFSDAASIIFHNFGLVYFGFELDQRISFEKNGFSWHMSNILTFMKEQISVCVDCMLQCTPAELVLGFVAATDFNSWNSSKMPLWSWEVALIFVLFSPGLMHELIFFYLALSRSTGQVTAFFIPWN